MPRANPADYNQKNGETVAVYFLPKGAEKPFPPRRPATRSTTSPTRRSGAEPRTRPAGPSTPPPRRCGPRPPTRAHDPTRRPRPPPPHREGGRPGRWEGTRLRPGSPTPPRAAAAHREPAVPGTAAQLARGVRRDRGWCSRLGYLPDAFEQHFPTAASPAPAVTSCSGTRWRTTRSVPPQAADPLRGPRPSATSTSASWCATATCSPPLDLGALVAFHDERGAEATISLTQVVDPSPSAWCPPVPTVRSSRSWRSPAGQGAHQLDQRGHLRARAVGAGAHPRALAVSIERADFPRMLEEPRVSTPRPTTRTGSTSAPREKYLQPTPDVLGGALPVRRSPVRARCNPACGPRAR